MAAAHAASDALVTMAVIPNPAPDRGTAASSCDDGRRDRLRAARRDGPVVAFRRRADRRARRRSSRFTDGVPAESVGRALPRADRRAARQRAGVPIAGARFATSARQRDYLGTPALAAGRTPARCGRRRVDVDRRRQRRGSASCGTTCEIGAGARLCDECVVMSGARVPERIRRRVGHVDRRPDLTSRRHRPGRDRRMRIDRVLLQSPERVTTYLERSGLGAEVTDASCRSPAMRPTGATSGCCGATGRRVVLALHVEPFDAERAAVRVASRSCSAAMPLPSRRILDRAGDLGHPRARGSRRRHAAGASRRGAGGRAQPPLSPGRLVSSRRCSGAARSWPRRRTRRTASPSTSRSCCGSSSSSRSTTSRRTAARRSPAPTRTALSGGMARAGRGTGRGAARAVSSRLSQPQPDAAPRRALHHRLPGRATRARHLRPGVAAARLVRRSVGSHGRRAHRVLHRAQAAAGGDAAGRTRCLGAGLSAGAST